MPSPKQDILYIFKLEELKLLKIYLIQFVIVTILENIVLIITRQMLISNFVSGSQLNILH